MSKKGSGLSNLVSKAQQEEKKQKEDSIVLQQNQIETIIPKESNDSSEILQEKIQEPILANDIKKEIDIVESTSKKKIQDYFSENDYGVGDLNIKIPISLHKKFKLLSAYTGVPMTRTISNILNEFLIENKKEIDKLLK